MLFCASRDLWRRARYDFRQETFADYSNWKTKQGSVAGGPKASRLKTTQLDVQALRKLWSMPELLAVDRSKLNNLKFNQSVLGIPKSAICGCNW